MLPLLAFALLAAPLAGDPALAPDTGAVAVTAPLAPAADAPPPAGPRRDGVAFDAAAGDTTRRRPKAVEYSDAYGVRVTIHKWASFAMPPLLGAQYLLGRKLESRETSYSRRSTRDLHTAAAAGIAGLFALNTVTGVWNLVESRKDPNGRGKRIAHSVLMLAADAGFAATGLLLSDDAGREDQGGFSHRNVAIGSMGLATVGSALMWFFKD